MRKTVTALFLLGLALATTAYASNPVRISQVYGGGGTPDGRGYYSCDYVELFNNSDAPVDIGGWSIQFASPTNPIFGTVREIPSGAVIPACGYYLIQGACSTAGGADLPVTPDLVLDANFTSFDSKQALFADTLSGRTCADAIAYAVDLVGHGEGTCYETAPTPVGNDLAVHVRAYGGAVDTDDNSADWTVEAQPWPMHNSASPPNPNCQLAGVRGPALSGLALAPPAPNPVRGTLRFTFDLPRAMHARLDVVDVQGRVVAALTEGDLSAGRHERTWDAAVAGERARAGLYFVRLETPGGRLVRRVALLR